MLGINLKGTFLCMQKEARAMLAAGHGGAIVNVGSVSSFLGFATGSAYCTLKHGLIGLTTSVSAKLASRGIRVNLVCPGIVDTPMHRRLRRDIGDDVHDQGVLLSVHLQRAGEPGEIARAIIFLCSDDASLCNRCHYAARLSPGVGRLLCSATNFRCRPGADVPELDYSRWPPRRLNGGARPAETILE